MANGRQQTAECRKHTDYGIINLWRACACAWSIDYREGGTARHGTARACVDALCHCEEIRARENSENKRRRQARRLESHHHVYVYSTVPSKRARALLLSFGSRATLGSRRNETKLFSANSQHSRGSHFTSYKHHSSVITSFVSQYSTWKRRIRIRIRIRELELSTRKRRVRVIRMCSKRAEMRYPSRFSRLFTAIIIAVFQTLLS